MSTKIHNRDIEKDEITGAILREELGVYDETRNYNPDDQVWWSGYIFKCLNAVTGNNKGDLSDMPSSSNTDWAVVRGNVFSVFPTTSQSFTDSPRVTVKYDNIRYDDDSFTLDSGTGEVTIEDSGVYIINVSQTNSDANGTNDRSTSYTYIQIDENDGNGFSDIPNLKIAGYHRDDTDGETTGSVSLPLEFDSGWKIRVQVVEKDSAGGCKTTPDGCNLTLWAPNGSRGPRGNKGDTGSPGSGTTMTIRDDGTDLTNTPHQILDFVGDLVSATDDGSSVAKIEVLPTKHKYIQTIWAEENSSLSAGQREWAFGNGANTPAGHGVPIYVPSGYTAKVIAVGISCNGDSNDVIAEVQCEVTSSGTTTNVGSVNIDMDADGTNVAIDEVSSPVSISNKSVLNFRTASVSGSSKGPNVVTAYMEFVEN